MQFTMVFCNHTLLFSQFQIKVWLSIKKYQL